METIGNRIRELRKGKDLTQKQLADFIGTTEDSIFSWEKERAEPSISFIISLAKFFDVSTDYLFGLENDDGSKKPL